MCYDSMIKLTKIKNGWFLKPQRQIWDIFQGVSSVGASFTRKVLPSYDK